MRRTVSTPVRRRGSRPRRAGFTLVELLISLGALVLVVLAVLAIFDLNNKLSRVQMNVADMQQAIRVGQYDLVRATRMAGRGGVLTGTVPNGIAVAVRDNVPASGNDHYIAVGDNGTPEVLAGTDVLTVRGVFDILYQANPSPGNLTFDDPANPTKGTIRLQDPNPTTGVPQDLEPLRNAVKDGDQEALLIGSPLDVYAVVAINETDSDVDSDPTNIVIGFDIGIAGGTGIADKYIALSTGGTFSSELRSASIAGVLHELRFYIREEHAVSGDPTSDFTPRLSRARMRPGTEEAHPDNPTLADDIADNILDLQAALGMQTDSATFTIDDAGSADDEWLFNSVDDDPADAKWATAPLFYVRVTTVARTDRRDPNYQAPLLAVVENKDYADSPYNRFNAREERMFRRRSLQTIVDLRNLS